MVHGVCRRACSISMCMNIMNVIVYRIIMVLGRMGRLKMRMGKGSMIDGLGGGCTSLRF